MADSSYPLINGVSPTATGTVTTNYFATEDYRDFALQLSMPATTGTGADTLDIYIEESSESTFATAYKIKTVKLTAPDNSTTADKLTQVVGATALPADTSTSTTLRQKWNIKDVNVNSFLRARYVIATTAASFTLITLTLLANEKV